MRKMALLALSFVFFLVLCVPLPLSAAENTFTGADTVEEIFNHINELHISKPDPEILRRAAIEGMIYSLDDPYTEYLPPVELEDFNEALNGNYVGVGIQLQPGETYPEVVGTIENAPADTADIKRGDLVTRVDGFDISGLSLGLVVQKIRGQEGTKVSLTIRREGVPEFEVELVRQDVNIPTVYGSLLDEDTGYIRIYTFGTNTGSEFARSLTGLIRQGAKQLIVDVRDNPGGLLQGAVQIAGNFIGSGQVVVNIVDRNGIRQDYRTEEDPNGRGLPLVVLVNEGSASASEILSGALKDYGAATVIGGRTFGKGTVQMMVPLKAGGALKITTARYHTPKDLVIDGTGLQPDLQVLSPELQIAVARSIFSNPPKKTLHFEKGKYQAVVNGFTVEIRDVPLEYSGETFLPLRLVFEGLGCQVDWRAVDESITITGRDSKSFVYHREGLLTTGDQVFPVEPLIFENGTMFLPVSSLIHFNINVLLEGNRISLEK